MRPLMARLHTMGVRVYVYLDDLLMDARTAQLADKAIQILISVLISAGFILNLSKSEHVPS